VRETWDYYDEFRDRLDGLGLDAVLIGALAAARYRLEPRLTTDVDFLARRLDGLVEAMEADGYQLRVMAEPGHEPYVVFIRGKGTKVDVLRAETEYQFEALDRAVDGAITAEDVIVHKLLAWRSKDIDDIHSILATGRPLDAGYIDRWAGEWEVGDRWTQIRTHFGLGD
jgi:hypothetical protein